MAGKKERDVKTNAMRLLDALHVPYRHYAYECTEFVDARHTAAALGLPPERMYKTLVTEGAPRQYYVFVIPIDSELSLKKAARAVGVKSLSMIPVKDITAVTGYVRGGCTALGMKKKYPTVIDSGRGSPAGNRGERGAPGMPDRTCPRGFAPGGGCFLCGCSGTGRPPVRVLFRKCGYSR